MRLTHKSDAPLMVRAIIKGTRNADESGSKTLVPMKVYDSSFGAKPAAESRINCQ